MLKANNLLSKFLFKGIFLFSLFNLCSIAFSTGLLTDLGSESIGDAGVNNSIVALSTEQVAQFHKSSSNDSFWANIGDITSNGKIVWGAGNYNIQNDGGKDPVMAATPDGNYVVQMHDSPYDDRDPHYTDYNLWYSIGVTDKQNKTFSSWPGSNRITDGATPALTIINNPANNNIYIVDIHSGHQYKKTCGPDYCNYEWINEKLWYDVGTFNSDHTQINWIHNGYLDDGASPALTAVYDQNSKTLKLVEVYIPTDNNGGDKSFYYHVGTINSDGDISWGGAHKFNNSDSGINVRIAGTLNGKIIEVHKSSSNNDLWYSVGTLNNTDSNNPINWSQSYQYDGGYDPSICTELYDNNGEVLSNKKDKIFSKLIELHSSDNDFHDEYEHTFWEN